MSEHTRNQKRMYRIHKQEEKILEQELMIASLQQKVEQLEKENKELKYLVDDSNIMKAFIVEHDKTEQLENIRKEAIEYVRTHDYPSYFGFSEKDLSKSDLLNILNKGSDKK